MSQLWGVSAPFEHTIGTYRLLLADKVASIISRASGSHKLPHLPPLPPTSPPVCTLGAPVHPPGLLQSLLPTPTPFRYPSFPFLLPSSLHPFLTTALSPTPPLPLFFTCSQPYPDGKTIDNLSGLDIVIVGFCTTTVSLPLWKRKSLSQKDQHSSGTVLIGTTLMTRSKPSKSLLYSRARTRNRGHTWRSNWKAVSNYPICRGVSSAEDANKGCWHWGTSSGGKPLPPSLSGTSEDKNWSHRWGHLTGAAAVGRHWGNNYLQLPRLPPSDSLLAALPVMAEPIRKPEGKEVQTCILELASWRWKGMKNRSGGANRDHLV